MKCYVSDTLVLRCIRYIPHFLGMLCNGKAHITTWFAGLDLWKMKWR